MKPVSKQAQKVLDKLFAGLKSGESKKLDNAPGVFMALSVERLTEDRFSMAHYFEQNGDLCPDPDMEFWRRADGRYVPVSITQVLGYTQALWFGADGKPEKFNRRASRELASFTTMWCRNIKSQQGI